ncbi:MAG: large subunit ribosomal protein L10 [Alphaproteobacteria bacterium]|jgi:large subunit ribosomal protein L10
MDKAQKIAFVKELNETLNGVESIVVARYDGTTVSELEELRSQMRGETGIVQVCKNRLAKIAFDGTPYANLKEFMTGPTILTMGTDVVSAAKIAQKFADTHKAFEILGGAMGETKLDQAGVEALSKMPSLDEIRGKLLGTLMAPATQLVRTINEPGTSLVRVLDAKSKAA